MVGTITAAELRRTLDDSEIANGFANRYLMVWAERSKRLPGGGNLDPLVLKDLGLEVGNAIARAKTIGTMSRSPAAEAAWREVYGALRDDVPGLVGDLLARLEAQLLRLQVIYALAAGSAVVEMSHLQAACAVADYWMESLVEIFGEHTGDPDAEKVIGFLAERGDLTRNDLYQLTGKHWSTVRIDNVIASLLEAGRIEVEERDTGGRPVTVLRRASKASYAF